MNEDLPPLPKPDIPAVYATAQNTASVRHGHEMGGYVKREAGYTEVTVRALIAAAVAAERERLSTQLLTIAEEIHTGAADVAHPDAEWWTQACVDRMREAIEERAPLPPP